AQGLRNLDHHGRATRGGTAAPGSVGARVRERDPAGRAAADPVAVRGSWRRPAGGRAGRGAGRIVRRGGPRRGPPRGGRGRGGAGGGGGGGGRAAPRDCRP